MLIQRQAQLKNSESPRYLTRSKTSKAAHQKNEESNKDENIIASPNDSETLITDNDEPNIENPNIRRRT